MQQSLSLATGFLFTPDAFVAFALSLCGYLPRIIEIKLFKETNQLHWQLMGWLLCISEIDLIVWITHGNDVDARAQWLLWYMTTSRDPKEEK
jgi:hypothetical protein